MKFNEGQLKAIWEETLDLPCVPRDGPLHPAIITEALASEDEDTAEEITRRLYTLAQDIEDFANAITERAQGLT